MTSPEPYPKQLKDFVADALRAMIAQGELAPGDWLRQERLSEKLGVSFTPVREALKQLEAEGLLEHVPYRGVRVKAFSADDVADIYMIRSQLESQAAASAATHLTPEQLAQLQDMHAQMCAASLDDLQKVRDLNRAFHTLIIEASGRAYLARILNMIWTWFPTMLWSQFAQTAVFSAPGREAADNAEHAKIVAALEAHDPEAARAAMAYHIDQARLSLVEFLNEHAEKATP